MQILCRAVYKGLCGDLGVYTLYKVLGDFKKEIDIIYKVLTNYKLYQRSNMSTVYNNKLKNGLKRMDSVNQNTGEVTSQVISVTDYYPNRPNNGYQGIYMKQLKDIVLLNKVAQRLFFAIIEHVDQYNRIIGKWSTFTDDAPNYISIAKKELTEAGFIDKIGTVWVLNPYVVLPKYMNNMAENQYQTQQIWSRYIENMNVWYEHIDKDAQELFGVK